jgi:PilZ domain
MEFRRRVSRHPAGWLGYCHIDGEPIDALRECSILDISEFGVGIQLEHPDGAALIGSHVSVENPSPGSSVHIRLEGTIRNASPAENGAVRFGIEFVGITEVEQALVRALGALGVLSDAP